MTNGNDSPRWRLPGRISGVLTLVAGAAFLVAACDDATPPTAPGGSETPSPSFGTEQVAQEETPNPDDVSQAVPGFAGYYLDGGVPTVALTDPAQRAAAESALSGWLSSRGFTASDLQVREVRYDWEQLHGWYARSWSAALNVDGAVLGDVDEANNRIRFGGGTGAAVSAISSAVATTGIPSDAYVVERVSPIEPVITLRDRVRPTPGGYQINFLNAGGVVGVSLLCTLGFNAIPEGPEHEANPSFITNSHCSIGEADGALVQTEYYQPLQDPDGDRFANEENFFAVEVDDPTAVVSPDCPDGLPCRWADASRAEYAEGVPFELGRIARPAAFDDITGTLEVDPKKSTFEIDGEQPFAVLGETAFKVGRTTGWTGGEVTGTCVDVIAVGGTFVRRCQAQVAAGVDSGDSGSPVFLAKSRKGKIGGGKVILNGILWGGNIDGDPHFTYSPLFNVERELGLMKTHGR